MTTLTNRTCTALLVVDVQNDVVAGAHDRDHAVANIARLVDRARSEHVPVVLDLRLVIAHANLYWDGHCAPGRRSGTAPADSVTFE